MKNLGIVSEINIQTFFNFIKGNYSEKLSNLFGQQFINDVAKNRYSDQSEIVNNQNANNDYFLIEWLSNAIAENGITLYYKDNVAYERLSKVASSMYLCRVVFEGKDIINYRISQTNWGKLVPAHTLNGTTIDVKFGEFKIDRDGVDKIINLIEKSSSDELNQSLQKEIFWKESTLSDNTHTDTSAPATARQEEIQKDMVALVKDKQKQKPVPKFTKQSLANELSKKEKYEGVSEKNIERLTRVTWEKPK